MPADERRAAQRDRALLGERPDAVERVAELLREPRADLVAIPEQAAEILHPLEVRDGDAAGVREHVGEHRDPALGEDRVGLDRRRAVRALGDELRVDRGRVLLRELILARGEHEDVARELEQLRVRDVLARPGSPRASRARRSTRARAARSSPSSSTTPPEMSETAITRRPLAASSLRGDAADVAEALHDAALVGELPAEPLARALDHHHDADAGRLVPEHASRRSRSACP